MTTEPSSTTHNEFSKGKEYYAPFLAKEEQLLRESLEKLEKQPSNERLCFGTITAISDLFKSVQFTHTPDGQKNFSQRLLTYLSRAEERFSSQLIEKCFFKTDGLFEKGLFSLDSGKCSLNGRNIPDLHLGFTFSPEVFSSLIPAEAKNNPKAFDRARADNVINRWIVVSAAIEKKLSKQDPDFLGKKAFLMAVSWEHALKVIATLKTELSGDFQPLPSLNSFVEANLPALCQRIEDYLTGFAQMEEFLDEAAIQESLSHGKLYREKLELLSRLGKGGILSDLKSRLDRHIRNHEAPSKALPGALHFPLNFLPPLNIETGPTTTALGEGAGRIDYLRVFLKKLADGGYPIEDDWQSQLTDCLENANCASSELDERLNQYKEAINCGHDKRVSLECPADYDSFFATTGQIIRMHLLVLFLINQLDTALGERFDLTKGIPTEEMEEFKKGIAFSLVDDFSLFVDGVALLRDVEPLPVSPEIRDQLDKLNALVSEVSVKDNEAAISGVMGILDSCRARFIKEFNPSDSSAFCEYGLSNSLYPMLFTNVFSMVASHLGASHRSYQEPLMKSAAMFTLNLSSQSQPQANLKEASSSKQAAKLVDLPSDAQNLLNSLKIRVREITKLADLIEDEVDENKVQEMLSGWLQGPGFFQQIEQLIGVYLNLLLTIEQDSEKKPAQNIERALLETLSLLCEASNRLGEYSTTREIPKEILSQAKEICSLMLNPCKSAFERSQTLKRLLEKSRDSNGTELTISKTFYPFLLFQSLSTLLHRLGKLDSKEYREKVELIRPHFSNYPFLKAGDIEATYPSSNPISKAQNSSEKVFDEIFALINQLLNRLPAPQFTEEARGLIQILVDDGVGLEEAEQAAIATFEGAAYEEILPPSISEEESLALYTLLKKALTEAGSKELLEVVSKQMGDTATKSYGKKSDENMHQFLRWERLRPLKEALTRDREKATLNRARVSVVPQPIPLKPTAASNMPITIFGTKIEGEDAEYMLARLRAGHGVRAPLWENPETHSSNAQNDGLSEKEALRLAIAASMQDVERPFKRSSSPSELGDDNMSIEPKRSRGIIISDASDLYDGVSELDIEVDGKLVSEAIEEFDSAMEDIVSIYDQNKNNENLSSDGIRVLFSSICEMLDKYLYVSKPVEEFRNNGFLMEEVVDIVKKFEKDFATLCLKNLRSIVDKLSGWRSNKSINSVIESITQRLEKGDIDAGKLSVELRQFIEIEKSKKPEKQHKEGAKAPWDFKVTQMTKLT